MTTHTPGPWYEKMQSSGQGLIASEATGQTVAIAYAGDADARLIAAAPEMLALLRRISGAKAAMPVDSFAYDAREIIAGIGG